MYRIGFWTPIEYRGEASLSEKLQESVENYFYLGGRKVIVLKSKGTVQLEECSPSTLATALKVASYFTVVIPLIMLIVKAIMRAMTEIVLAKCEGKLNGGVNLSVATAAKLSSLILPILQQKAHTGLTYLDCRKDHRVFVLESAPGIVFKINQSSAATLSRFRQSSQAQTCITSAGLSHLYIPQTSLWNIDGTRIIAEEKLAISPPSFKQNEQFINEEKKLEETVEQLANFIIQTGFHDVCCRNVPLIDTHRVAMIDLEGIQPNSKQLQEIGILGAESYTGLIKSCGTEGQMAHVCQVARKHFDDAKIERVREERRGELVERAKILAFHDKRGIQTGNEEIEGEGTIISELNTVISQHSDRHTTITRRQVIIHKTDERRGELKRLRAAGLIYSFKATETATNEKRFLVQA